MDFTLSFLDNYVSQRIEQGAKPYKPRCLRLGTRDDGKFKKINVISFKKQRIRNLSK